MKDIKIRNGVPSKKSFIELFEAFKKEIDNGWIDFKFGTNYGSKNVYRNMIFWHQYTQRYISDFIEFAKKKGVLFGKKTDCNSPLGTGSVIIEGFEKPKNI